MGGGASKATKRTSGAAPYPAVRTDGVEATSAVKRKHSQPDASAAGTGSSAAVAAFTKAS